MKKALLIFCVIVSVNIANGECPLECSDNTSCWYAMNDCKKEKNTLESMERAIYFCKKANLSVSVCGLEAYEKDLKRRREQAAKQEREQAAKQERFTKCRNGNADACFEIGYEEFDECNAYGNCTNPSEALTYFSKACKLKHEVGCFNVGAIMEQSEFFKNPQKAQEYYRKSCNMGYEPACFKVR